MSTTDYPRNSSHAPFGSAGTLDVKVDRIEEGLPGDATTNNTLVKSSLTTTQGSNRDLTFTSALDGPVGNLISVTYVNPLADSQPLTVSVSNYYNVVVSLATNSGGTITSTASQILAAIMNQTGAVNTQPTLASQLVTVTLATGSSGAGTVAAMSQTYLTGYAALASYTTGFGSNADLTWTALNSNEGNDVTITYVNPARDSASLTVTLLGNDSVVVGLATNSGGTVTTTASQIITAVGAAPTVAAVVGVALASGSSGAGTVAALATTKLSGYGVITRNTFDAGIAGVGGTEPARQSATVYTDTETITQTSAVTRSNPTAWAGN